MIFIFKNNMFFGRSSECIINSKIKKLTTNVTSFIEIYAQFIYFVTNKFIEN